MSYRIACAPCCWGVDDPKNPYLPPWQKVLSEASQAGYKGIELGPYGYLPIDAGTIGDELAKNSLAVIAGTIFDNLVDPANAPSLRNQVDDICRIITSLPQPEQGAGQHFPTPYLVLIDWGHDERDYAAGHPDTAPRLDLRKWSLMAATIRELAAQARGYGVRAVIHPHAGGYIEFADEIDMIANDVGYDDCGFCLDTGHLTFSRMDPAEWLRKYASRIDYLHFKDIDGKVYEQIMKERIRFFDACGKGVMCPIGQGIVDYTEIHGVLGEIGYSGFITIEQERDPRNSAGSLEAVRKSREFLESHGF